MRVAILSNLFKEHSENKEVEEDLMSISSSVKKALMSYGHEAIFFDVNEKTFEKLRRAKVDIAFNVCERFRGISLFEPHVAAMLELLGIPYTGSGPLTLATCINKIRVKEIISHYGIPTPKYQVFRSRYNKLNSELKFPLFVKPACMDNSIGITNDSVVYNEEQLRSKVGFLLKTYEQPVLVEEYIDGRELTVGILGNNKPIVLPLTEVIFDNCPEGVNRILGYEAKWDANFPSLYVDDMICPANNIPKYLEARIKKIALDVYQVLGVRDYGRVDIRLSKDNIPYVLEMNPNPGISADCFIPKAAKALGLTYKQMVYKIFTCAVERYNLGIKIIPKNSEGTPVKPGENGSFKLSNIDIVT